jgi:bacteriorhodopsin
LQVVLLLVSFAGFGVVMHAIVDMFAGAMAESGTDGTSRQLLGRMLALTLVVWSLFPLVWLLGQAGVVSLTVEQVCGLQGG